MTLDELIEELNKLHSIMDGSIDTLEAVSARAQDIIYQFILDYINYFEIADGRFVVNQSYARRILFMERRMKEIIGDIYAPSIKEFLPVFNTIEETNIFLHEAYNGIAVPKSLITPAKQQLYEQAAYYLEGGLAAAYVQPAKYLLMQQITRGTSLADTQKILKKWNEGELPKELNSGRQTPNLQKYATQIARDTVYQSNGAINQLIAERYELDSFIYTGDIIRDSRPLCRHLVGMHRKIKLDEMPALIKRYPQGLYPNTTKKNFLQLRAGYNCRHSAFAVR